MVRARLRRSLVALRDRLVAMYENGTPDMLNVILESDGYQEVVDRTEYLERIHGMDEAVVTRVRDLRDQVRSTVARLRSAKDRIESARDAIAVEEQALAGARQAVEDRQSKLVATRAEREEALEKINSVEEDLDGDVSAIQGELAATLAGFGSAPLPAGPIQPGNGSGLIWPVERTRGLAVRNALGSDARGDRHRRPGRDADPRRGIRHASSCNRAKPKAAATATSPASTMAAGCPPATPTSRPSRSAPGRASPRGT